MSDLASDARDRPIQVMSLANTQILAFTGTAANSNLFTSNIVRLYSTEDVHIASGNNAVATTSDAILPQGVIEYFEVPHSGHRFSALQVSAGGSLYITEMK